MTINAEDLKKKINKLGSEIKNKAAIEDINLQIDPKVKLQQQQTEQAKVTILAENKNYSVSDIKCTSTLGTLPGVFNDEICLFTALA